VNVTTAMLAVRSFRVGSAALHPEARCGRVSMARIMKK